MDSCSSYITVDPETAQISKNKEDLVKEAKKRFKGLFQREPEQAFWCYGYDVACAGPIPEGK